MAERIVTAGLAGQTGEEVEFTPARVLFQDFTGVPVFVDFAVMREACADLGGDPKKINPQVPCDLVIDHSVMVDEFGNPLPMPEDGSDPANPLQRAGQALRDFFGGDPAKQVPPPPEQPSPATPVQ